MECDGGGLVWEAFVLTAGIYGCFVVGAVLSSKRSFNWLASFISVGLWVMGFTYLFARFGWISYKSFDLVYVRGGLVLYAAKTGYDTQPVKTFITVVLLQPYSAALARLGAHLLSRHDSLMTG